MSRVLVAIQLGHQQRQVLSEALKEAYLLAGIRDDEPSTCALPPPTFPWVLDILWTWAAQKGPRRATVQGCIAVVESVFGHPLMPLEVKLHFTPKDS